MPAMLLIVFSLPLLRRRRELALESLDVGARIVSARVEDVAAARAFVVDEVGGAHPRFADALTIAAALVACARDRGRGELRLALTITPAAVRVELRADRTVGVLLDAGAGIRAAGERTFAGRPVTRCGFTGDHHGRAATWCELGDLEAHR